MIFICVFNFTFYLFGYWTTVQEVYLFIQFRQTSLMILIDAILSSLLEENYQLIVAVDCQPFILSFLLLFCSVDY